MQYFLYKILAVGLSDDEIKSLEHLCNFSLNRNSSYAIEPWGTLKTIDVVILNADDSKCLDRWLQFQMRDDCPPAIYISDTPDEIEDKTMISRILARPINRTHLLKLLDSVCNPGGQIVYSVEAEAKPSPSKMPSYMVDNVSEAVVIDL